MNNVYFAYFMEEYLSEINITKLKSMSVGKQEKVNKKLSTMAYEDPISTGKSMAAFNAKVALHDGPKGQHDMTSKGKISQGKLKYPVIKNR
jgi:hypothetical protein